MPWRELTGAALRQALAEGLDLRVEVGILAPQRFILVAYLRTVRV